LALVERLRTFPVQAGAVRQADVLRHDTLGDVERLGYLLVRELGLPLQPDDVLDHA